MTKPPLKTAKIRLGIDIGGTFTDVVLEKNMEIFSYGVGDRGASIRIPIWTVLNEYKGYLEDRRPSSNGNPYKITNRIIQTIKEVK